MLWFASQGYRHPYSHPKSRSSSRGGGWFPGRANRRGQQRFTFGAPCRQRAGAAKPGQHRQERLAGREMRGGRQLCKNTRKARINGVPSPPGPPGCTPAALQAWGHGQTDGLAGRSWGADPDSQVAGQAAAPQNLALLPKGGLNAWGCSLRGQPLSHWGPQSFPRFRLFPGGDTRSREVPGCGKAPFEAIAAAWYRGFTGREEQHHAYFANMLILQAVGAN